MNDLVSRAFDTLYALLIASILGTILLGASAVFASDDSPFGFDESGKLYQRDTWSPISPNSRRTSEADQRNYNDWVNSQTLRQNEALIESYDRPSAPSSRGNQSFWFTPGPGERSRLCSQVGAQIICQ